MDFELTEEQKRFKQEVREFLDKEVTEGVIEESKTLQNVRPVNGDEQRVVL